MKQGKHIRVLALAALFAVLASCANQAGETQKDEDLLAFGLLQEGRTQTGQAVTNEKIRAVFDALDDGSFTYDENVIITGYDGTRLAGNLFLPAGVAPGEKLPAIIFVNSWSLEEHEYIVQAALFAKKGYAVLSYSTRGFGLSEGLVNVAGPDDMRDLGSALDWLEANTPVDVNNIGVAGISYGAGISLLGAANHDRIKTAAAMSGWARLSESLYGGESPRLVWGTLLLVSGYFTGRMDPIILQQWNRILSATDIPEVLAWADERSPEAVIDGINAANKPIYISNNFSDNLFAPNPTIRFFEALTGPKKLDLNQGIHATAEIGGLLGAPNFVWDNVHQWFDYHLRGIDTGIMDEPLVTMEKKLNSGRAEYHAWPAPGIETTTYHLKPRYWFWDGKLQSSPNTINKTLKVYSGMDTLATSGIPLIGPILEAHVDLAVKTVIDWISDVNGVKYESGSLADGLKLRGAGRLTLRITPSRPQAQLNVYLYDEDFWGVGTLITFGTLSLHDATPGQAVDVTVDLSATAYDVPPGHRIAVAVDTFDPQFAVPTLALYNVKIKHSSGVQNTLELQTENE